MLNITLKSLSEAELAALQTQQSGNNCAIHAIAAALKLLVGTNLPPAALSAEVDRLWRRGRFFRLFPGWSITPGMQARLVNFLSRSHNLPLQAQLKHLAPEALPGLLQAHNQALLLTFTWLPGKAPALYHGTSATNYNVTHKAGGHTMLLAAYNPEHRSGNLPTPWGFINSWVEGGPELFWMQDDDLRKGWNIVFFPLNLRLSVIIKKLSDDENETDKITNRSC
ncbi:MAG TPA: hypothetical protein DCG78_04805 [Anaerolineaceae bacterium]|nr:hypothetical protein [Anaerolineaceae bacterium]